MNSRGGISTFESDLSAVPLFSCPNKRNGKSIYEYSASRNRWDVGTRFQKSHAIKIAKEKSAVSFREINFASETGDCLAAEQRTGLFESSASLAALSPEIPSAQRCWLARAKAREDERATN